MPKGVPETVPDDGLTTRQRRNRPLFIVHTGAMKGKSTAAFGLALRGWNQGWGIAVYQFVKSAKWKVGEETALCELGRHKEVWAKWRQSLEAKPSAHDDWHGYAELCLFLGHDAEYIRVRRELLTRFGATTNPHVAERLGRACLLLPATDDELRQAVALVDRAVTADPATYESWAHLFFQFAKGLAEYRLGRFDSAIGILQGHAATVMGPAPNLVLAMAQHRRGNRDQARRTLPRSRAPAPRCARTDP